MVVAIYAMTTLFFISVITARERFLYKVVPGTGANEKETNNMAFSREFIRKAAKESGVEIPKELEDALVNEHISARDAYAEAQVKAAEKPPVNVKDSDEYKQLKQDFDNYKAEQGKKESRASKETAFKAVLKDAGISESGWARIVRHYSAEVDALELDDNGKAKDTKNLIGSVKSEWPEFVTNTRTKGADPANPPANGGGKNAMTREEIDKIKDTAQRRAAMRANPELYGIERNE